MGGPGQYARSNGFENGVGYLYFIGVQRLRKVWVDGGHRDDDLKTWVAQLKQTHKVDLEVGKEKGTGFTVLPRRWVVERTFAWLLITAAIQRITES